MDHFVPGDVATAARYVDWWGRGNNCLSVPESDRTPDGKSYGPGSKLYEAETVCRAATALLRLDGPRGPGRVVAVVGRRVVFVYDKEGYVSLLPAEVGGFTAQPVAQYLLRPGSPSQWIRGCYVGGAFALTVEDARRIGFVGDGRASVPGSQEEATLFGSNVQWR